MSDNVLTEPTCVQFISSATKSRLRSALQGVLNLSPLVLGLILLVAGLSKLFEPYEFLSAVYAYGLTGRAAGFWVAWLLPWLEVTVGGALLAGTLEKGASLVAIFLSLVFVYVKFHAIHEDKQIGCGCVVTADRGLIGISDLVWAVLMFVLAGIVFFLVSPRRGRTTSEQSLLM